ncbi:MAG: hypothetical protein ACLSE7_13245 [Lachnospirales bacterium]
MEALGAIVFLPRDERGSSLFLDDILFDPAALWLTETLRREGVERFLVICGEDLRDAAAPCFPAGASFAAPDAPDFTARVLDFLAQVPGPVIVVTRPVLLAPAGTGFARSGKEPPKSLFTLRGAALAAALQDGRSLDETLSALGDARPWQGRFLPLTPDPIHRATEVEPLARGLGVERMLSCGVRVIDTESTFVGPAVTVGAGAALLPGSILRGRTSAGTGCVIGPNTMIRDCQLGERVTVNSSQLNESVVDDDTTVGPFAYIRPHCHVGKNVKVGDFVELKNSTVGDGTKISHLTYVGDTDAGAHINFGCGTVTVNYDGTKKFRTTIGDHAFIGCNTNLVAPVTVGEGAYTAAGSTITGEVPADALGIARARQVNKDGWAARRRKAD